LLNSNPAAITVYRIDVQIDRSMPIGYRAYIPSVSSGQYMNMNSRVRVRSDPTTQASITQPVE